MKPLRFALGCAALLLMWGGLAALALRVMTPVTPAAPRPWLALVAGGLVALGLQSLWYLAFGGVGRGSGSRQEILRRAAAGEAPPDGGFIVATGTVRALGAPLVAPLSGRECAAYMYRMFYRGREAGKKRALAEVPVFWGHSFRPFAIDHPAARFRVMAVPLLGNQAERREGDAVVAQARQWVASTAFEDVSPNVVGSLGAALAHVKTLFSDEDGEDRRDYRRAGEEGRDPGTLILEETLLPVGEVASVSGRWSAAKSAIVAGGGDAVAETVSAVLGPPERLKGPGEVPPSFASYLTSAIVLTALGAGLVWFSIAILPGMK